MFHAEYFKWRTIGQLCPQSGPAPALCTSVATVRSAIGAEERGWRAPGFHGHTEAAVGTHTRYWGPPHWLLHSSTEWKNETRVERERAHTKGGGEESHLPAERGTDAVLSGEWVFACSRRSPVSQYSSRREELLHTVGPLCCMILQHRHCSEKLRNSVYIDSGWQQSRDHRLKVL